MKKLRILKDMPKVDEIPAYIGFRTGDIIISKQDHKRLCEQMIFMVNYVSLIRLLEGKNRGILIKDKDQCYKYLISEGVAEWVEDEKSKPDEPEYESKLEVNFHSGTNIYGRYQAYWMVADATLYQTKREAQAWKDWLDAYRRIKQDADRVNGGWKPDWENKNECKNFVRYEYDGCGFAVDTEVSVHTPMAIYFKHYKDAQESAKKHEKEYKILAGIE